ncbi:hypothetical protein GEMRC1_011234 [Eukaryota sp. GEM-RC1]
MKKVKISAENCDNLLEKINYVKTTFESFKVKNVVFSVALGDLYRYLAEHHSQKRDNLRTSISLYKKGLIIKTKTSSSKNSFLRSETSNDDSESSESKSSFTENNYASVGFLKTLLLIFKPCPPASKVWIYAMLTEEIVHCLISVSSLRQLNKEDYLEELATCPLFDDIEHKHIMSMKNTAYWSERYNSTAQIDKNYQSWGKLVFENTELIEQLLDSHSIECEILLPALNIVYSLCSSLDPKSLFSQFFINVTACQNQYKYPWVKNLLIYCCCLYKIKKVSRSSRTVKLSTLPSCGFLFLNNTQSVVTDGNWTR